VFVKTDEAIESYTQEGGKSGGETRGDYFRSKHYRINRITTKNMIIGQERDQMYQRDDGGEKRPPSGHLREKNPSLTSSKLRDAIEKWEPEPTQGAVKLLPVVPSGAEGTVNDRPDGNLPGEEKKKHGSAS